MFSRPIFLKQISHEVDLLRRSLHGRRSLHRDVGRFYDEKATLETNEKLVCFDLKNCEDVHEADLLSSIASGR